MVAKEEDYHARLLIPLALDNYLFEKSAKEWIIGEIRNKRQVQSFVTWQDRKVFDQALEKVITALRTDGGKPPPRERKLTSRKGKRMQRKGRRSLAIREKIVKTIHFAGEMGLV